ncbi:hypothetical protein CWT12_06465 [Actinomyces sp. 432]|uniref:hypothetical protein n=1 Tax=Actinomyces sp. 432 TaxID=2057798 RepID=UPI0013739EB3|nr:hypothetical protein [Actinomyces sp. 432]QHO91031.1 hypothetical protein CWT12_06465 [Actinomyces sp. 432]
MRTYRSEKWPEQRVVGVIDGARVVVDFHDGRASVNDTQAALLDSLPPSAGVVPAAARKTASRRAKHAVDGGED